MKPYNVLVVDDSAFMRKIISDLIESDPKFRVAATAVNGREAVEKVGEILPDLVTMDVEMPELNGLEALKLIMKNNPLPVIMLSGINEEGMRETILALEGGAFDFIRKPSISSSQDIMAVGESLREQMNAAMQARERREARSAEAAAQAAAPPTSSAPPAVPPQSAPSPLSSPRMEKPSLPAADKPAGRPSAPAPQAGTNRSVPPMTRPAPPTRDAVRGAKEITGPAGPASPVRSTGGGIKRPGPERAPAAPPAQQPLRREAPKPGAAERTPAAGPAKPPLGPSAGTEPGSKTLRKLVAVGTSTGGPRALKALLENIPGDFPAPVVIVQHMPPSFTKSLAQRLNTFSQLEVMEAEHGMVLKNGSAYVAPGGYHMKVADIGGGQYAIQLTKEEARNGHRPSVDTLFESLLPLEQLERHAVIMTGMGNDGARMMKALYDAGVTSTFAENEETCVVYGMPRSAVELQCVTHILPLQDIAPKLVQVVR